MGFLMVLIIYLLWTTFQMCLCPALHNSWQRKGYPMLRFTKEERRDVFTLFLWSLYPFTLFIQVFMYWSWNQLYWPDWNFRVDE